MKELIHPLDPHRMNWVEGAKEWGTVVCKKGLEAKCEQTEADGVITERYTFTNTTEQVIFTSLFDISIYATFNDEYLNGSDCITNRCHAHVFCGGEVSWVLALRMGGFGPHLGLVLTEGSLGSYSVERDLKRMSNDRGDIILHPSPAVLEPGQTLTVEWRLFWHDGKEDFFRKAMELDPRFVRIDAERYVLFEGEPIRLTIRGAKALSDADVRVTRDGEAVPFEVKDGIVTVCEKADAAGERRYDVTVGGVSTYASVNVLPELWTLAKVRCGFIASRQQYLCEGSHLDGAYLEYDNEEEHMRYDTNGDHNAARERCGMALLIIRYLMKHPDAKLEASLDRYTAFVYREIFDAETGETFNDYLHNNERVRLYNYPWMVLFFTELYLYRRDPKYLTDAAKASLAYYAAGGAHFYAFETPYYRLVKYLEAEGMNGLAEKLTGCFRQHADTLYGIGTDYPPHEVHYEQSIVAPAAELMLEFCRLTEEKKYLEGAVKQLDILEKFNGMQPDYHMNEVALRHWDGYWFGKRKCYGDTFPHYWSALTGNSFFSYYKLTGDEKYLKRAEDSMRGPLSMFFPDGRASCAFVFPYTVNGQVGSFWDPYANDQDWALYFMLRFTTDSDDFAR